MAAGVARKSPSYAEQQEEFKVEKRRVCPLCGRARIPGEFPLKGGILGELRWFRNQYLELMGKALKEGKEGERLMYLDKAFRVTQELKEHQQSSKRLQAAKMKRSFGKGVGEGEEDAGAAFEEHLGKVRNERLEKLKEQRARGMV